MPKATASNYNGKQDSMTLGTFQPRARITGDKMNLAQYAGRPLLVRTMEFVPDFASPAYPNPKPVVFADVVDLITGQIFINVLWGAGAVVDNLKDKAGTEEVVPVKPGNISSPKSGRTYIALFPLESGELEAAQGWYNANWAHVDNTRAQRMQAAAAAAPAAGVPAAQAAPAQQFGGPVQGFQGQPNQQGQFAQPAPAQAPATQFGAPAAQPPANPAYQPQAAPAFGQPQQPQYQPAPPVGPDPNAANGGVQYAGQPAPQFGAPQAQPAPVYQQQAPQGFGAPQGGVFTDAPPAPPAGAPVQYGAPQGQDPAAAAAALAHLNQQVQPQQ